MIPIPSTLALKLVAGACAILMLALLIHERNRWKSTAALRQQQVVSEKAAHSATVANYRAAAEQARRQDAENLARVKAGQAAINERTRNDFESRIAAARARVGELRQQAGRAAADTGRGGAAPVPRLSASAQRAAEAAGEDRLSQSDKRAGNPEGQLGAVDALIATEQAIQLDELIKWIRRQAEVDSSGR